jgi:hypothetical protein
LRGCGFPGWGRPLPQVQHADQDHRVGYYIPAKGSTWASYRSPTDPNGEVVYTTDVYRGGDVLRITAADETPRR